MKMVGPFSLITLPSEEGEEEEDASVSSSEAALASLTSDHPEHANAPLALSPPRGRKSLASLVVLTSRRRPLAKEERGNQEFAQRSTSKYIEHSIVINNNGPFFPSESVTIYTV